MTLIKLNTLADNQYISEILPLPQSFNQYGAPIPQFVTENGLTVFGNIYGYAYAGKIPSYPSYQVVWHRSSINSPFEFNWLPELKKDYPYSFYEIKGITKTGDYVFLEEWNTPGYVRPLASDEDEKYPPIFKLVQLDIRANKILNQWQTFNYTYGLDPDGQFVLQDNADNKKRNIQKVQPENFSSQYNSVSVINNQLPGKADDNDLGITPDYSSLTSFPQLTYDTTIVGQATLGIAPNDSSIWFPSGDGLSGSMQRAQKILTQKCKFTETQKWTSQDWLFVYQGTQLFTEDVSDGIRVWGEHINPDNNKSMLFQADIPTSGCVSNGQ